MSTIFFITHPEVVVDPTRPVHRWHLADRGIERMRRFAWSPEMQRISSVWASEETKANRGCRHLGRSARPAASRPLRLNGNDRSATGFLPPLEFERVADEFFTRSDQSVRGWERAIGAQQRVFSAFGEIVGSATASDLAIIAHGGVGTLLLCHLSCLPISHKYAALPKGIVGAFRWLLRPSSARGAPSPRDKWRKRYQRES